MTARDLILSHEGLRLKPYVDTVGKITIGVGRNLTDVGISQSEAMVLFENDLERARNDLFNALPWAAHIDETRQMVLLDMCFNLGLHGLLTFTDTLELVSQGLYTDAADAMLRSRWATQVGARATTLAAMMRTGPQEV